MEMTAEQWNGLVALIRAIAVAASEPATAARLEAKRQAGACESNVRKMFVDTGAMSTRSLGTASPAPERVTDEEGLPLDEALAEIVTKCNHANLQGREWQPGVAIHAIGQIAKRSLKRNASYDTVDTFDSTPGKYIGDRRLVHKLTARKGQPDVTTFVVKEWYGEKWVTICETTIGAVASELLENTSPIKTKVVRDLRNMARALLEHHKSILSAAKSGGDPNINLGVIIAFAENAIAEVRGD